MNILRKATFIVAGLAVVFAFTSMPLYGTDAAAKDKGQLREVVFIHHKLPFDMDYGKPENPGKPDKPDKPGGPKDPPPVTCTETVDDSINDWGATGWHMTNAGLTYNINYGTVPRSIADADFQNAIADSTNTWSQADNGLSWTYGGSTTIRRSSYDGTNLIAFGNAMGGIAVTRTWYWTGTGEIAESDIIFGKGFDWSITDWTGEDCAGVPGAYDVQNIATHEFGHQVGLVDLYDSSQKDLTMYGYGDMAELKKDSLGTGDVTGARALAP